MIRFARPDDAEAVAQIYAPVVRETAISFEVEPPDAAEMRRRIEKTFPAHPWIVDEREGRIAGYAYASRHRERGAYRWSVDVTCYVHADFRGGGVGSGLYRALFRVLRAQGFQSAFACVALPNEASVRLHEAVGFRRIGVYPEVGFKLGAWRDTLWLHHRLGDAPADPPDPRPLSGGDARILLDA